MNIDNIFYIIKSAIISVPSNTWQRSLRTTLHSRQTHSIISHSLSDLTQVTAGLSSYLDQL